MFAVLVAPELALRSTAGATASRRTALHTDVSSPVPGPWETFECVAVGHDELAFRMSRGTYLTAVNGGGIGGPNANPYPVHTDATKVGPWEEFGLVWRE